MKNINKNNSMGCIIIWSRILDKTEIQYMKNRIIQNLMAKDVKKLLEKKCPK